MKDYIINFDLPRLAKRGASAVAETGMKLADAIVSVKKGIMSNIHAIKEEIETDIAAVRQRDPAAGGLRHPVL